MITRLAHVCLHVANLDASLAFYEGVLELRRKFEFLKGDKLHGAYVEVGPGNYIEMFERPGVEPKNTGIVHFCLETGDIDEAIRSFDAKGVAHTEKKRGADSSWQTWVSDPDGNRIELHQYTEESAQLRGQSVQVNW
ncbi:MAG: VOC family protein [Lentisphaeria bacterium]|jgi:catechol 2,3-dioxygenase-like lactoylglutathione lyase family enzyme|nr:VOC family protein [Lentisphaeria bacterium]